jgi:hypothetical protein
MGRHARGVAGAAAKQCRIPDKYLGLTVGAARKSVTGPSGVCGSRSGVAPGAHCRRDDTLDGGFVAWAAGSLPLVPAGQGSAPALAAAPNGDLVWRPATTAVTECDAGLHRRSASLRDQLANARSAAC